jgi:hypothetical protein
LKADEYVRALIDMESTISLSNTSVVLANINATFAQSYRHGIIINNVNALSMNNTLLTVLADGSAVNVDCAFTNVSVWSCDTCAYVAVNVRFTSVASAYFHRVQVDNA